MVKFPVVKNGVCRIDTCMGKGNFFGLFQGDVGRRRTVFGIGGIIVVIVYGHDS